MKTEFKQINGVWRRFADGNPVVLAPYSGSQEAFLLLSNVQEVLYSGPRGSGKSLALLMSFLMHVNCGYGSAWRGLLLRRVSNELREIKSLALEFIPQIFPDAKYNLMSGVWDFPLGESLMFSHFDAPTDYMKYQGHSYSWIGWEEITNWPSADPYLVMMATLRSSRADVPKMVRAVTNPFGPGYAWVKERFKCEQLDDLPDGEVLGPAINTVDDMGRKEPERRAVRGFLYENKLMMLNDPDYGTRTASATAHNKAQFDAWHLGLWRTPSGSLLGDEWNAAKQYALVPDFEPPPTADLILSLDWGISAPYCAQWFFISKGEDLNINGKMTSTVRGDVYLIAEQYGWSGKPNKGCLAMPGEVARRILQYERERGWRKQGTRPRVRYRVVDGSVFDGQGQTVASEMERAGLRFDADTDRADKSTGSRVAGLTAIRQRLYNTIPVNATRERPGLFICEGCFHWQRTVPSLPRSEKDYDDSPDKAEDHACDCTRYAILGIENFEPRISTRRRTTA
jgi:hypothetical protein